MENPSTSKYNYTLDYQPEESDPDDIIVKSYDRLLYQRLSKIFGNLRRWQVKEFLRADENSITELLPEQDSILSLQFPEEELQKLSLLWITILCRYQNSAELLIRSGADVDEVFGNHDPQIIDKKWTILHMLLQMDPSLENEQLIRLVIDRGANLEAQDSKGQTVLHIAVSEGRVKITEMLLEKLADVNAADKNGVTPLHKAASNRKADKLVPLLVEHGADVLARNINGENALHYFSLAPVEHIDAARFLIEKGASLKDRNKDCSHEPIHLAAYKGKNELVKLYLDHGANVNARGRGYFLLYLAVVSRHSNTATVLQTLLNRGANINQKTRNIKCRTALHEACSDSFDEEKIKILLSANADLHAQDSKRQTALHLLIMLGKVETIKMFLEKEVNVNIADNNGVTPVLEATRSFKANEIMPLLMKYGANVQVQDNIGNNALHYLSNSPVEHIDLARILIMEKGVSLDHFNRIDQQPLHVAVCQGKIELLKVYLLYGADINANGRDGFPLYMTVVSRHLNAAMMMQTLLEYGANVNQKTTDENGYTALHEACGDSFDQEKIEILLSAGADINARDSKGRTVLHIAVLKGRAQLIEKFLKIGADIDAHDNMGSTPLLEAAQIIRKDNKLLLLLMEHGADVLAKDKNGKNVLHYLSSNFNGGHEDLARVMIEKGVSITDRCIITQYQPIQVAVYEGKNELVKLFLDYGANVNDQEHLSHTAPLYIAASSRNCKALMLQTLLERGANVNDSHSGYTALHKACELLDQEKILILLSAGADMFRRNHNEVIPQTPFDYLNISCQNAKNTSFMKLVVKALALRNELMDVNEMMSEKYPKFWSYYQDCNEQISKMKSTRFIRNFTFFELFTKCYCEIAVLMRNPEFEINFKSYDLTEFSMYAEDIKEAFERAKKHYDSVLEQEDVIAEAVYDILPHMIVRKMTHYILDCENAKHQKNLLLQLLP